MNKRRVNLVILCLAASLWLTTTATRVPAQSSTEYADALTSWASLLQQHVDDEGRVNFAAIAAEPSQLKHYVDTAAVYGPASHPEAFRDPDAVLAYHANTYNALAMWGVIQRNIPDDFSSFFKRASFFRFRGITVAQDETNLYDYENKVIRPLGEPRMHFALNCMVRDCPRLPGDPFLAETLQEQLDAATREFFRHPRNLKVDDAARTIYLSSIMDFYTEDFVSSGKPRDLSLYVNAYLEAPLPADYQVKFIPYDWTINRQP